MTDSKNKHKNNWLDGEPDIGNGLMCVGKYSSERDDTEYIDVYSYPDLSYIGRYNSSRFDNPYHYYESYPYVSTKNTQSSYDFLINPDFRKVGEFQIWRHLFPDMNTRDHWLEKICWGHPDLVTHTGYGQINCRYTVTSHPRPFNDIIKEILKENNLNYTY